MKEALAMTNRELRMVSPRFYYALTYVGKRYIIL